MRLLWRFAAGLFAAVTAIVVVDRDPCDVVEAPGDRQRRHRESTMRRSRALQTTPSLSVTLHACAGNPQTTSHSKHISPGRSHGRWWAVLMATIGQVLWPSVGRTKWPLTRSARPLCPAERRQNEGRSRPRVLPPPLGVLAP